MLILQVVGIAFAATILLVVLRERTPEMAMMLALVTGVIILLMILVQLVPVLQLLEDLASQAGIDRFYLLTVLKIIGIAYLAEFAAQVCRDAGEGAVAAKVALAGKVVILVLAVPIIKAVVDLVIDMMPV